MSLVRRIYNPEQLFNGLHIQNALMAPLGGRAWPKHMAGSASTPHPPHLPEYPGCKLLLRLPDNKLQKGVGHAAL